VYAVAYNDVFFDNGGYPCRNHGVTELAETTLPERLFQVAEKMLPLTQCSRIKRMDKVACRFWKINEIGKKYIYS
jgi:hypothetical protein